MNIRSSSLDRIRLCPGSYIAEQNILDEPDSAPAAEGKLIHELLCSVINLSTLKDYGKMEDAVEAFTLDRDERAQFIVRWFAGKVFGIADDHGGPKEIVKERAHKIAITDDVDLTGHDDLTLECQDGTVHVVDYKSGRLAVDTSDMNMQVKAYGLMVAMERKLEEVTCHIMAAGNEGDESHTFTTYEARHLEGIFTAIMDICTNGIDPKAQRIPGLKQCQYCDVNCTKFCVESKVYLASCSMKMKHAIDKPTAMFSAGDEHVGALITAAKYADKASKSILDAAKETLKAKPRPGTGWEVGKDTKKRSWEDPARTRQFLITGCKLNLDMVDKACKFSVGAVDKAIWENEKLQAKNGGRKPCNKSALMEEFTKQAGDLITIKKQTGSLKAVKKG